MPTFAITYPGFDQRTGDADVTWSRGTEPSQIHIDVAPDYTPNPAVGPVQLLVDGVPVVTLADCAGDGVVYSSNEAGQRYTTTILDRRWRWKEGGGYISGHYNRRFGDNSIVSGSEKSPRELVDLLLDALGETGYDTSAVSTSLSDPPEVRWDHVQPVQALSNLLSTLGLELCLRLTPGNPVKIVVPGVGGNLPTTNRKSQRITAAGIARPESLVLIGGETLIEGMLELEPVARNDNDEWVLVNSLSYTPSGGWEKQDPDWFGGITGATTEETRRRIDRARADIFRAYRVKGQAHGGSTVPTLDYTVSNVWQYQLQDRLLEKVDRSDGQTQWKGAELYGLFFRQGFRVSNDPFGAKYDGEIQVMANEPIIIVDKPLRRIVDSDAGTLAFPKLWLKCVYSILDENTRAPVRTLRTKTLGANGAGSKPVYHDEVYRTLKISYTPNSGTETYAVNTVTDSKTNTDAAADYYLDAEAKLATPLQGEDNPYAGFIPIELDGRITQVTWSLRGGSAETRASTSTEHSDIIPRPQARKRIAATRAKVKKEQTKEAGIDKPRSESFKETKVSEPVAVKSTASIPQITTRWVEVMNVSASVNIPPFGPFKLKDEDTPQDTADERDYVIKVMPLTEAGLAGTQTIGFAGPLGIEFGKPGRGTFEFPTIARMETGLAADRIVYATDSDDILVAATAGDEHGRFQAVHKVATNVDSEDWIVTGLPTAGGTCDEVDEFWIEGVPTSGTVLIGFELDRDPDDATAPVYEEIEVPYNATSADFRDLLWAHTVLQDGEATPAEGIGPDSVEVFGGPWPFTSIYCLWKGDFGGRAIPFPSLNSNDLNGGAKLKSRKASSSNWGGY